MSGDPLWSDIIGGERRQFLPDFATDFEMKGKMEKRIGWRGQNESQIVGEEKRNGRLYGVAETSKERAEWRRFQQKNLSILSLPKRKGWPQERRSRPCQKEKKQSRLSRV